MEAGAQLDQRRTRPAVAIAGGGREDAGDQLEQRRLAGAVAADDAEGLAAADLEGDLSSARIVSAAAAPAASERPSSALLSVEKRSPGASRR